MIKDGFITEFLRQLQTFVRCILNMKEKEQIKHSTPIRFNPYEGIENENLTAMDFEADKFHYECGDR